MDILIIGKNGQIGGECIRILGSRFEVTGLSRDDIDILDTTSIESALEKFKPDMVINATGYTDVEKAESEPEKAFAINAQAPGILAETCAKRNIAMIHFSTDYVFDGDKESYIENDTPRPLNTYGASKYEGEKAVARNNPAHYIIRTSAVFGGETAKPKFVPTMLKLAAGNKTIKVINDQYTSPTYIQDLVDTLSGIIREKMPYGIYHITNAGQASWFEFAHAIFDITGIQADLQPISLHQYGYKTKRPIRSILKTVKLRNPNRASLRNWKDALRSYLSK